MTDRPMLFEVFTDSEDESKAIEIIYMLNQMLKVLQRVW